MLKIGLTGGISSGKTTASRAFLTRGIPVLDADQLVRELSSPGGAGHAEILARFGTDDRKVLRERIYQDPRERKALEAILHPKVAKESQRRLEEFQMNGAPAVVYEAALLIEAGRAKEFDELVVVVAPEAARIRRLCTRDQLSEDQARRILQAQLLDEERIQHATYVLRNDGDAEKLAHEVELFLIQRGLLKAGSSVVRKP